MRSLGRLKALQALEAAARHGSFVGASAELGVTAAAVGQLVRSLEDWVGHPLLERTRSGTERLAPTSDARLALTDISEGLDHLEKGLLRLRGRKGRSVVVVTASQVFVANWLVSRLEDFANRHPRIDVRLDVGDRVTDLAHSEADLGVRCGLGQWRDVKITHLMDEEVIAVCSPSLMPRGRSATPTWMAGQTLIHDSTPHPGGEFPTWDDWLRSAGVNSEREDHGLHINSTSAVIQAALAARGLALVRKALVKQHLESGSLRHLMPGKRWPIRWAYYVVVTDRALRRHAVRAFHDWLVDQAKTSQLQAA